MIAVFERVVLGDTLTATERAELARLALTGPRAREWIAGRAALHRLLGPTASVVTDADGAPRVIDDPRCVSLSHDDAWVAVAVAARPVAIDLCATSQCARVARILARLGIASANPAGVGIASANPAGVGIASANPAGVGIASANPAGVGIASANPAGVGTASANPAGVGTASANPGLVWAALECALKLRRRGVWTLLDARLAVRGDAGGAWVEGIGAPVRVAWWSGPAYAIAWTDGADADAFPTWGCPVVAAVGAIA